MEKLGSKSMARKRSQTDPFKDLTWDDLQEWAGATIVSRGQRYQRSGLVRGLGRTLHGGLVAWVQGTHRYATTVEMEDKTLNSACTCPYGGVCKHAVAVVLDYLEHVTHSRTVPTVTEQDRRLQVLETTADGKEWAEEDDEAAADEDFEPAPRQPLQKARTVAADALPEFLERQTQPQLLGLLKDLAQRYPDVRQFLQDRHSLSEGVRNHWSERPGGRCAPMVPDPLVKAVRAEIAALSEEPGWRHHWNDEGYTPDYSRVRDRLEALLAQGHADAVVEVGAELLEAGTRQVEMSDDEGETAEEIASCLDIVFRALPRSSRSPAEQMRWAVEADLADEYELCRGAKAFWDRRHPDTWRRTGSPRAKTGFRGIFVAIA